MGDEVACTLIGLTGQLVAADGIVGADGLMAFDERCCEQFAYHIVEGIGLYVHRLGNLLFLVIRYRLTIIAQHL